MKTIPKSIALVSALAVVGASALAVARDEVPTPGDRLATFFGVGEACPPLACTIVYKTDKNGPPSRLVAVD